MNVLSWDLDHVLTQFLGYFCHDFDKKITSIVMNAIFSCLSGDDSSTSIPITANNVEIVASQDSSINSKARGSSKVRRRIFS